MRGGGRAVSSNDVHQESRTAAGGRCGAGAAQGSGQGGPPAATALSGPLHACPSLEQGVDGTLLEAWASHKSYRPRDEPGPAQGRLAQPRRRPPFKTGAGFPGRAPQSRDARVDHRSRCAPVSQGQAARGAALLLRSRADREPEWSRHCCRADRSRPLVKPGAGGYAEREAALAMLERSSPPRT